jgi:O-antigen/teichoic acid export membrane protein
MSLLPAITRLSPRPEEQRKLYGSALAQVFAGALPIAVGGSLLAGQLVTLVFGAAYASAVTPLRILVWCVPIALFRNVAQAALIAHGRQQQMFRTTAWAAGVNVALNATLIPSWGMAGAAAITVLTEVVRTGLALRLSRLVGFRLPSPRRFWRSLLAAGVMAAVVGLSGVRPVWLSVATGAAVYGLTLVLVGGLKLQRRALPELTV